MHSTAQILVKFTFLLLAFSTCVNADDKVHSLTEVYQQALENDPALASALSANQAAQEVIEQAKALYRPTVSLNAGVNATQTDIRFLTGFNPFRAEGRQNFETYNYGVQARQPIYRKDSLVQIDQSKVQVSQADKRLNLSKQDLILRVTQAYFDVLLAQDRIDLIIAQKAAILSQLEQAKANFEVGTATITDVNEAQARFDLVAAQEIAAVNEHQIAKYAVQAITGQKPQRIATVKADMVTTRLEQGLDQWVEVALENNLNIQIQQDALALSTQEVERLRAGHLPTLDAIASHTNNYANGSANGFGTELKTSTIGLQLEIPLYQGGAVSSRVRQAVLNQQRAQDDIQIARRSAELETQRAYLNLNSSIAQVKAFEQALISSQTQLDSTKLGYEVGVRTSVDVLNVQQQLFTAKRDLLQARYSYLVNIIRLKATSGVVAEPDLADINQQLLVARAH
ncbi:MAG: TolC family outer membrane protein [Methylotenera sp.]|nr:TolC family outer membrane protein [Methylotenera sp.]MDO9232723.1 TolC family outer membrane protein [Methylotenera sp.]MDO9390138.1 TolC family outer membrane protein [Methylotenera sp.]MDP1597032.1 TolC family outer membrane protein [Methylotenera sp.]MDP1755630.1 TolC family outer membrane protein [Methylotenera sp.]